MAIIPEPEEFFTAYFPPPSLPTMFKAQATRTYDDATGELISVQWVINAPGTLLLTLFLANGNTKVLDTTVSGQFVVPKNANVFLVRGPKGDWQWPGIPGFTVGFIDG